MANRFLDTNYYKSPFVRSLKGSLKSFYSFIICDCDGSGIWNLDLQAAEMYTGFCITMDEFESHFVNKGKAIFLGGGKYFFPDFIEHQYPSGLQANNKAHKNFINTLAKYGLIDENQKIIKKEAPLKDALKASHVMYSNGNGQGNGNGLLEETGEKKWNTKPGKEFYEMDLDEVKAGAVKELFRISKNHNLTNDQIKGLWYTFKIQNFTGKRFYQTPDDAYSHFINWSKTQNITNGTTHSPSIATSNGRVTKSSGAEKLVASLKEDLNAGGK